MTTASFFSYFVLIRAFLFIVYIPSLLSIQNNEEFKGGKNAQQKIIIIADPGVDDTAAILMAVSHPDINVLGILSNFGVVSSTDAYENAKIILNVINAAAASTGTSGGEVSGGSTSNIPVYVGSDFLYGGLPINHGISKGLAFHGPHGLGDFSKYNGIKEINYTSHLSNGDNSYSSGRNRGSSNSDDGSGDSDSGSGSTDSNNDSNDNSSCSSISCASNSNNDLSAVEFLLQACKRYPGEISIMVLSPATTLATALAAYPSLPSIVKRVYIMGGSLRVAGNVSPIAEFNFGADSAAASLVLVKFTNKITILPLDITMKCLLNSTDLENLALKSGYIGKWFANDLAPFYMKAYYDNNKVNMPLHDAHTVGSFIRPDLYAEYTETIDLQITVSNDNVINGMLFEDKRIVSKEFSQYSENYNKNNGGMDNNSSSDNGDVDANDNINESDKKNENGNGINNKNNKNNKNSNKIPPPPTATITTIGRADIIMNVNCAGFLQLFTSLVAALP